MCFFFFVFFWKGRQTFFLYLKKSDIQSFQYVRMIKLCIGRSDRSLQDASQIVKVQVTGWLGKIFPVKKENNSSFHDHSCYKGKLGQLAGKICHNKLCELELSLISLISMY